MENNQLLSVIAVQAAKIMECEESLVLEFFEKHPIRTIEDLQDNDVTPFSDIMKFFHDENEIGKGLVRKAIKIFKKSEKVEEKNETLDLVKAVVKEMQPISDMSIEELLTKFDPKDSNSKFAKELKNRYQINSILVFDKDNKYDPEATLDNIKARNENLIQEDDPFFTYEDGTKVKCYSVGQRPSNWVDESPFSPGTPLRNDRCSATNLSFKDISYEKRQFLRIVWEDGFIDIKDRLQSMNIIERSKSESIEKLFELFSESALRYREAKDANALPNLKVNLANGSSIKKDIWNPTRKH